VRFHVDGGGTTPLGFAVMHRFLFLSLGAVILALMGCESAFEQSYRAVPVEGEVRAYSGMTEIYGTRDLPTDRAKLEAKGYVMIGFSEFSSTYAQYWTEKEAQAQAKRVGADVVLLWEADMGAEVVTRPVLEFKAGESAVVTSNSTTQASAWRSDGLRAQGNANTQQTSFIEIDPTYQVKQAPTTVRRTGYVAVYFKKRVEKKN